MSIGVLLRGFIGDMMDFGDVILRTLFPSFMTIQACTRATQKGWRKLSRRRVSIFFKINQTGGCVTYVSQAHGPWKWWLWASRYRRAPLSPPTFGGHSCKKDCMVAPHESRLVKIKITFLRKLGDVDENNAMRFRIGVQGDSCAWLSRALCLCLCD